MIIVFLILIVIYLKWVWYNLREKNMELNWEEML